MCMGTERGFYNRKRVITIDNNFSGEQITVIKGLSGTEKIIRAGVNSLQEGEKVTVIEQPEKVMSED